MLVHCLSWIPVEAGIYRLNRVVHPESVDIKCDNFDESPLPETFVDYEKEPREYRLKAVHTILDVHTRCPTSTRARTTRSRSSCGSPSRRSKSTKRAS